MTLVTGEIVDTYDENGITMGKIRVGAAYLRVSLMLVEGARIGDRVLIESGVAIARASTHSTVEE
jgi:hydrogenase maturation factor